MMMKNKKSVRCLGIDPGIANTGWTLVVKSPSGYQLLADGWIRTIAKETTGDRLLAISRAISEAAETNLIDRIAIERCFHNTSGSCLCKTRAG